MMSFNGPRFAPDSIVFGEIACCAFEHCGIDPDAQPMREKLERLVKIFAPRSYMKPFRGYLTHFERTLQLCFPMRDAFAREFFIMISHAEIDRLKALSNPLIPCGHTTREHIAKINGIIAQITAFEKLAS